MHEKVSPFSTRKIVLMAFLLAVLAFAMTADVRHAEAIAGPSVCSYYSDATFTTVVGARGTGCCGETISWGITTPYQRCQRLYCTDQLCPF
ncbi:MAG: DUF6289 family protein [Thermoanaerobaculia bacterium]